jgi:hypothetical protein
LRRARRLAGVSKDDEDSIFVGDETGELALGAGNVARRGLRPRGAEPPALVALQEIELQPAGQPLARGGERHVEELALGAAADRHLDLGGKIGERAERLVGSEHGDLLVASGEQVADRDEVADERRQRAHGGVPVELVGRVVAARSLPPGEGVVHGPLVVFALRVDLTGGIDDARRDVAHGALREHREAAQRLDLVTPELDAHGVARRREHVDDAAAHGELAAAPHLLDTLVAELGELHDDVVERLFAADGQSERTRLRRRRQKALQQRRPITCAAGATSAP